MKINFNPFKRRSVAKILNSFGVLVLELRSLADTRVQEASDLYEKSSLLRSTTRKQCDALEEAASNAEAEAADALDAADRIEALIGKHVVEVAAEELPILA